MNIHNWGPCYLLVYFISGQVKNCPGYISLVVNDWLSSDELVRSDAVISCPPQFNITVVLPIQQRYRSASSQTFEVILDDAKTMYALMLVYSSTTTKAPAAHPSPVSDDNLDRPFNLKAPQGSKPVSLIKENNTVLIIIVSFCKI